MLWGKTERSGIIIIIWGGTLGGILNEILWKLKEWRDVV